MPHNFQQISTGRFLARFDNLQPAPPEADHLTHVAAEYGIPVTDLRRVETDADLRDPLDMTLPPAPPPPDPDHDDFTPDERKSLRQLLRAP